MPLLIATQSISLTINAFSQDSCVIPSLSLKSVEAGVHSYENQISTTGHLLLLLVHPDPTKNCHRHFFICSINLVYSPFRMAFHFIALYVVVVYLKLKKRSLRNLPQFLNQSFRQPNFSQVALPRRSDKLRFDSHDICS